MSEKVQSENENCIYTEENSDPSIGTKDESIMKSNESLETEVIISKPDGSLDDVEIEVRVWIRVS